jgi:undecaprenyl phosphate-alpha-L-ara4FN deformylase
MKIGLRIDVDTFRGTRIGVPNLCQLLRKYNISATFYFSVGPDNMGRHLWRLLKPDFLWKMLRTNAASLYGPEIILMGTMWPGPLIGKHNASIIKDVADEKHEIGLHAWDHHQLQAKIEIMTEEQLYESFKKGYDLLTEITGNSPVSSAMPGWRCNDNALIAKSRLLFNFNSDCRGVSIFRPDVHAAPKAQIQVPVTLPTYDEVLGRDGVDDSNYNEYMLSLLQPDKLNVLTIHAEAEGNKCLAMFEDYIIKAQQRGYSFVTLGELVRDAGTIPFGKIVQKPFPGREGWLACQEAMSG